MKCIPITREGAAKSLGSSVVAAAILVIDIEDVFVPRMAVGLHKRASCEKTLSFKSGIS
jgi:hypothetical protein